MYCFLNGVNAYSDDNSRFVRASMEFFQHHIPTASYIYEDFFFGINNILVGYSIAC